MLLILVFFCRLKCENIQAVIHSNESDIKYQLFAFHLHVPPDTEIPKCGDQNPINKMKSPFCHLPKRRKCEKMKMKLINGDFISNDNQHKNTIKRGDMPKSSDHYQCCWCLFLSFSRSKITIRCCCIEFQTLISSVASFCIL